MKPNNTKHILRYLMDGGKITPMKAANLFNCYSLPQEIHRIREMGIEVKDRRIHPEKGNTSPKEYRIDSGGLSSEKLAKIEALLYEKISVTA